MSPAKVKQQPAAEVKAHSRQRRLAPPDTRANLGSRDGRTSGVLLRAAGSATGVARATLARSASRSSRSTRSLTVGTTTAPIHHQRPADRRQECLVRRAQKGCTARGPRAEEPQPGATSNGGLPPTPAASSPLTTRFGSSEAKPTWERTGRAPPTHHPGGWVLCAKHREPARLAASAWLHLATDPSRHQRCSSSYPPQRSRSVAATPATKTSQPWAEAKAPYKNADSRQPTDARTRR